MSFLNSVLSSIETGDVPPPPTRGSGAPSSSATSSTGANTVLSKATPTQPAPSRNDQRTSSTPKRKADSNLNGTDRPEKAARPSPIRPASQKGISPSSTKQLSSPSAARAKSAVDSKPPPKGSYADMMAQAKALQSKAPMNLGTITHQTTPKERRSKVQQKRLDKEGKQREEDSKTSGKLNGGRHTFSGPETTTGKFRDTNLRTPQKPAELEYKGTARKPQEPAGPAYKGTGGRPPRHESEKAKPHRKTQSRPSRVDEYLGTDEEDEGGSDGGHHSDESTDMEAGMMDMENEEQAALRIAKNEDEKELQMEMDAKKEKLARKKKLQQLATKTRR